MVTQAHPGSVLTSIGRAGITPQILGWIVAAVVLGSLLALLTIRLTDGHYLSEDQAILGWVSGWDFPGLSTFFAGVTIAPAPKPD